MSGYFNLGIDAQTAGEVGKLSTLQAGRTPDPADTPDEGVRQSAAVGSGRLQTRALVPGGCEESSRTVQGQ